jgi:hypothetical protein
MKHQFGLFTPNSLESARVERRVSHGVGDLAVAHVGLKGSRIEALIDECEARGVAQGMRVHLERAHSRRLAQTRQHLAEPGCGHGAAAFREEHEFSGRILGSQPTQGAQFVALDGVNAANRALKPLHIQAGGLEVHIRPADIDQFAHPQGMAKREQDHAGVAVTIATVIIALGRLHQGLDLALRQMFAAAHSRISLALGGKCPIYRSWLLPRSHRKYLTHLRLDVVAVPQLVVNGTVYTTLIGVCMTHVTMAATAQGFSAVVARASL